MHRFRSPLALAAVVVFAACRTSAPVAPDGMRTATSPAYAGLDAALWTETAAEAFLLRVSTYAAATEAMEAALADPARSALDQGSDAEDLPPAVILDIDETTLDNMAYNAWMVLEGESFSRENWWSWVQAREAKAIPGAVEFCRRARELGVTVYYVSNRDAPQEEATRDNLAALGFPLDAPGDALQMRGERPEWGSDKSGRYEGIGRSFRVLVLVGDDLNDFLAGARGASLAERHELAERDAARFGRDWFLLPNPVHGSWLRSAIGDDPTEEGLSETERRLRRLEAFEPSKDVAP